MSEGPGNSWSVEGELVAEPVIPVVFKWQVFDQQGHAVLGAYAHIVLAHVATWAVVNRQLEIVTSFGGQFMTQDPAVVARWLSIEWEVV